MSVYRTLCQFFVTATAILVWNTLPLAADERLDALFDALRSANAEEARRIDRDISAIWSRSGSAAMDLLLRRGTKSLEDDDVQGAIEHFTALTDHAPDFAEGWHHLAQAYFRAELAGPALDALEHALALEPRHYDAINGLATMLAHFGDYRRAELAYRKVLGLNPHHEAAKQGLETLKREGIGRTL